MNEPSPFAPFQLPTATPAAETKPEKAPRKKHAGKSASVEAEIFTEAKPERKKRDKKAGLKAYSPKFELQTILAVAATLNEDDFPLFEKLIIALDEAGKPARERIMAAIGKVFG